jgi:hypothetical protein
MSSVASDDMGAPMSPSKLVAEQNNGDRSPAKVCASSLDAVSAH